MTEITPGNLKLFAAGQAHPTVAEYQAMATALLQQQWRPMDTAPRDGTRILLLTGDFEAVTGWWDGEVENFYKSCKGSASYEPDPAHRKGDWVSDWVIGSPPDHRLFCGATPVRWMPLMPLGRCAKCNDLVYSDSNMDEVGRLFCSWEHELSFRAWGE